MQINVQDKSIYVQWWLPTYGTIGQTISIDTETFLIQPGETPDAVIAQAYAGDDTVYLIKPEYFPMFLAEHFDSTLIFHNAAFDLAVLERSCGYDFDSQLRSDKIFDIGILYRLIHLAKDGKVPSKWNLALITKELIGVELNKDDSTRLGFDRYQNRYDEIPDSMLEYAALDAVVTYQCYQMLSNVIKAISSSWLSHRILLAGEWALYRVQTRGMKTDIERVAKLTEPCRAENKKYLEIIESYGYFVGKTGNKAVLLDILTKEGIDLQSTEKGNLSTKHSVLEPYRDKSPFVAAYCGFKDTKITLDFLGRLCTGNVHTTFNSLLNTGRTSSRNPNVQNLPRAGGIRTCFVPRDRLVFLQIDFNQIELVALAQVCIDMFGFSKLGDLIREGVDVHKRMASLVLGKPESEITKDERQLAKAANFGFPGGLGVNKFINYAVASWGIKDMTKLRAKHLKIKWLELFPEMVQYLDSKLPSGASESVKTRTGRIRANASYCEVRNGRFQGLVADGAKIALYRLERAGFRVVNFIHDEYLIEIPENSDFEILGKKVKTLICDAMALVIPDVPIDAEWFITDRWYKKPKFIKGGVYHED